VSVFDVKNVLQQPNTAEATTVVQERIRILRERVESLRLEQVPQRRRSTPLRVGTALALVAAAAALVATAHGTGSSTKAAGRSATSSSLGLGRIPDRFESGTEASTVTTRPAHRRHHVVVPAHVRVHARRAPAPVARVPVVRPAPAVGARSVARTAVAAAPTALRHAPASTPAGRRHTTRPVVSVSGVAVNVVDVPDPNAGATPIPAPSGAAPTTTEELPQP
jgi:hypothetical protein